MNPVIGMIDQLKNLVKEIHQANIYLKDIAISLHSTKTINNTREEQSDDDLK